MFGFVVQSVKNPTAQIPLSPKVVEPPRTGLYLKHRAASPAFDLAATQATAVARAASAISYIRRLAVHTEHLSPAYWKLTHVQ